MTKMEHLRRLFSMLEGDHYTIDEKLEIIKTHRDVWKTITDDEAIDLVYEFKLFKER